MQSDVSPDSEGVFQEHIALVENIHGLIDYVTLKSNLLLDADLASYHLMSIAQVNRGVLELDDANQQNAAMVEQASAATESLRGQASILVTTVGGFNGGQRSSPTPGAPSSPKRTVTLPVPRAQTSKRQTEAQPVQGNEEWTEF